MRYFAYGSNMDPVRMQNRGIHFSSRVFAVLNGYELLFNKKAKDGHSSYANIRLNKHSYVEGCLYEIGDEDLSALDKFEGHPTHYERTLVIVKDLLSSPIQAWTYIARPDIVVEGLLPTAEYIGHVLAGADLLSPDYVARIREVETSG